MNMLAEATSNISVTWPAVALACIPILGLVVKDWIDQRRAKRAREAIAAAETRVVQKTDDQTKQIVEKVDENTAVNKDAIAVGNSYNEKIAAAREETRLVAAQFHREMTEHEHKDQARHNELKTLIADISKPAA